ncbi:MAG: DUF1670 domain-containing protein [Firmicutes bacterium]|nr:DUF1670 domain-containing protein [Bacillota bacterium]MBU4555222.1 DUF1670 domain-containing protein [Bacillota bacterium]MBV1769709.1 DUF1670 domain-containing protein [Desulforudis sp.]
MNRHELYRPLVDRSLENYQMQYLVRKYDFGKESLVAHLLVKEINGRMDEVESALGIERVRPFKLYVREGRREAKLPLFQPAYLEPILAGGDFRDARALTVKECLKRYRLVLPKAAKDDVLRIINPWALVRRRGPSSYARALCSTRSAYDPEDAAYWSKMIETIRPAQPTERLQGPDLLAPGRLLKELREFTAREAGLGPVVARQLVEEVITLRNICCPRTRELKPGEMPLVVTHVSARLSEDRAIRFRRLAPVIITVWTPEELANPPQDVRECLELLKRRIVRVCFEAYRQNGLLTLMDLQWVFQLPSVRISELIRSVQREHNLVVPTPGTILDAGRSMTHKDVIVGLHLEGYTVKEIARMTYHSPKAVDNYIGTFEAVLILYLFGLPPELMVRILRRGRSLINEHLVLVREVYRDHHEIKQYLVAQGVKI